MSTPLPKSPKTASAITPSLPSPPATGKPFRVLVVEDDAVMARVAMAALAGAGLECSHAPNATTAMQAFTQSRPHLVLLDVMLPDGDGRDLCRRMREQSLAPLVMMTSLEDEETHLQSLKAGADDYIPKPFNPRILAAHIVAHLRRTYRYAPAHATPAPVTANDAATPAPAPPSTSVLHKAVKQSTPEGWETCEACGYMGPQAKFIRVLEGGARKTACPYCGAEANITFSIG